ncbi:MAG: helix-turn-helix transcriptional regulator [Labrenzia sp.]
MVLFREETASGTIRREPPRGYATLIVSFADPITVSSLHQCAPPANAFVVGATSGVLTVECGLNNNGIEFQLRPWFAAELLSGMGLEPANALVDLTPVLPSIFVHPKCLTPASLADHLEGITSWLLRCLATAAHSTHPEILKAWNLLEGSTGSMKIADLADHAGISHRHFKHLFELATGLKPKRAARLLRLGRAVDLIENRRSAALSQISYTCGYSDQSHLTREFQDLAGISPAALQASAFNDLQGFPICAAHDVSFVQDVLCRGK